MGDVLLRRTRLGLLDAARALRRDGAGGAGGAAAVAEALAAELGWDEARVRARARRWRDEAAAEGLLAPDERGAGPIRLALGEAPRAARAGHARC